MADEPKPPPMRVVHKGWNTREEEVETAEVARAFNEWTPDRKDLEIASLRAEVAVLKSALDPDDIGWHERLAAEITALRARVAELEAARDSYRAPADMQEFWREAIGDSYQPVKWGRYRASNAASVKDVLGRIKAGELCPEAADVIVALVHAQSVAWNIAGDLGDQMRKLQGDGEGG